MNCRSTVVTANIFLQHFHDQSLCRERVVDNVSRRSPGFVHVWILYFMFAGTLPARPARRHHSLDDDIDLAFMLPVPSAAWQAFLSFIAQTCTRSFGFAGGSSCPRTSCSWIAWPFRSTSFRLPTTRTARPPCFPHRAEHVAQRSMVEEAGLSVATGPIPPRGVLPLRRETLTMCSRRRTATIAWTLPTATTFTVPALPRQPPQYIPARIEK